MNDSTGFQMRAAIRRDSTCLAVDRSYCVGSNPGRAVTAVGSFFWKVLPRSAASAAASFSLTVLPRSAASAAASFFWKVLPRSAASAAASFSLTVLPRSAAKPYERCSEH